MCGRTDTPTFHLPSTHLPPTCHPPATPTCHPPATHLPPGRTCSCSAAPGAFGTPERARDTGKPRAVERAVWRHGSLAQGWLCGHISCATTANTTTHAYQSGRTVQGCMGLIAENGQRIGTNSHRPNRANALQENAHVGGYAHARTHTHTHNLIRALSLLVDMSDLLRYATNG